MKIRGTIEDEVIESIEKGEEIPAKKGRLAYRKNFQFESRWHGKYFQVKQVVPVVENRKGIIIIITVYSFYF